MWEFCTDIWPKLAKVNEDGAKKGKIWEKKMISQS